jgi:hypothetical protein
MRVRTILAGPVMLLLVTGCFRSETQKQAEELAQAGKQMAEAMAGAGAAVTGGGFEGKATEAVDFRELKALLPEELPGMRRTSAEGQKNSAMGFTLSTAEARYESEGGGRIHLTITDAGAMAGMAAMGMYAWAGVEIDQEDEDGYEKTTTLNGRRGYEKYNRSSNSGQVSLMVGGRFIVELDGDDVSMDDIKSALDRVDLDKLEGMKGVGVK